MTKINDFNLLYELVGTYVLVITNICSNVNDTFAGKASMGFQAFRRG